MARGTQLIAITAPFLAFATVVLILRLYTRFGIVRNSGAEDFFVGTAWVFAVILFGLLVSMRHELNYHITVLETDPAKTAEFLKRFFVGIFMYNFSLTSSKLSIALQYRRIFTDGKINTLLWCIIALIIINCIWPFFTNLFFCNPVNKFWEPQIPGSCLNRQGVWFSYAGANIATSMILLVSPLPAIWRLQMRLRTKICLCFIFSFGIFDVILSCLRLASLASLSRTGDVSWYIQPVGIWSCLESTVAIICASAPALKPLISNLIPKFFSTRHRTKDSYDLPERRSRKMRGVEIASDTATMEGDDKVSDWMGDLESVGEGRMDTPRLGTVERSGSEGSFSQSIAEAYGDAYEGDFFNLKAKDPSYVR